MSWMLELYLVMVFWEPVNLLEGGSNWHVVTRYGALWSYVVPGPAAPYDSCSAVLWPASVKCSCHITWATLSCLPIVMDWNLQSKHNFLLYPASLRHSVKYSRDLRPGMHAPCGHSFCSGSAQELPPIKVSSGLVAVVKSPHLPLLKRNVFS